MKRAIVTGILLAFSCRRPTAPETRFPRAPVILISIDTLRADHLPAWGYRGVETPNLDRFRRDAILFRNAYANCPMTLPSHLSMLTGLLPPQHGVRDNAGFRFDSALHPSIPTILKKQGYATGAAISSFVLRGETGLADAFDRYDDSIDPAAGAQFAEYQRPGAITEQRAERWIRDHAGAPFFYFFHIYEPHVPYDPPEPFRSRYANAYDGEIAAADAIVGKLLDSLRAQGLYDRALIVITSDHGEGLGDHGEQQHSILLYREALQVPLLLKLPGGRLGGSETAAPAQLADLPATILGALGAGVPASASQTSLLSLAGANAPPRMIYSESLYGRYHFGWNELRSAIDSRWQVLAAGSTETYDLLADPHERHDVAADQRRVTSAARGWMDRLGSIPAEPGVVDAETAAKLAALGYTANHPPARLGPRLDPRQGLAQMEALRRGLDALAAGRTADAVASFRALAEADRENVEAWSDLGQALAAEGRTTDAISAYREALRHSSSAQPDVALSLAELELQNGNGAAAAQLARACLSSAPRRSRVLLVHEALTRHDLAEASRLAVAAGTAPDAMPVDDLLSAEVAIAAGDPGAALAAVDRAERRAVVLEIPKVYRLESLRADALARAGRVEEAVQSYRREIELFPSDVKAYANLAVLQFAAGDRAGSDRTLAAMTRADRSPATRRLADRTKAALR